VKTYDVPNELIQIHFINSDLARALSREHIFKSVAHELIHVGAFSFYKRQDFET
jgi:predicted SprT family Zn-dependent metalloprotease